MSASSIRDMSEQLGRVQPVTDDQAATVRRITARHAHDDADLAALLGAIFGEAS